MIDLDSLSIQELQEIVQRLDNYKRYNKLEYITPYPYQLKFMEASMFHKQRYMRAGNRVGKTFGGAIEFAQHVTGKYQPYFTGEKIEESGNIFWCIGIDLDSVSKVLQKELFGTADVRVNSEVGTGTIPRSCIEFDTLTVERGKIRTCHIRHLDGGINTIHFYGANNETTFMGQTIKFIWIDEEPAHRSDELYSSCLTRTLTTGGHVMMTATPEAGMTKLNEMFENDETGRLYLQAVGWDDCPHITDVQKEEMLAGYPEWQHQMRMNGLPVLGSGAVFPFKSEEISIPPHEFDLYSNSRIQVIAGVDFGATMDPSVIVYAAYDPEEEVYTLFSETVLDESQDARTPENMSSVIRNSALPNIVVNLPHDSGIKSNNPVAKGNIMKRYGTNTFPDNMKNPIEYTNSSGYKPAGKTSTSVQTGLDIMYDLFKNGKLKVVGNMNSLFKEIASYSYNGSNSVKPYRGADHVIDASRYALMGLMTNRGTSVVQASDANAPQWTPNTDITFGNRPVVEDDDWTSRITNTW